MALDLTNTIVELDALKKIMTELSPLEDESRIRVLSLAFRFCRPEEKSEEDENEEEDLLDSEDLLDTRQAERVVPRRAR